MPASIPATLSGHGGAQGAARGDRVHGAQLELSQMRRAQQSATGRWGRRKV